MKVTQNFTNWEWNFFPQPYKLIQIQKSWYLVQQNFQISGSGLTCRAVKTKFHSQLVKLWVTFILTCHRYLRGFILLFQRKAICYNWRTDVSILGWQRKCFAWGWYEMLALNFWKIQTETNLKYIVCHSFLFVIVSFLSLVFLLL